MGGAATSTGTGNCAAQVQSWYLTYGKTEIANFAATTAFLVSSEKAGAAASIIVGGQSLEADASTGAAAPLNVPMPTCGDPAGAWQAALSSYYQAGQYATKSDVADSVKAMNAGAASLRTAEGEISTATTEPPASGTAASGTVAPSVAGTAGAGAATTAGSTPASAPPAATSCPPPGDTLPKVQVAGALSGYLCSTWVPGTGRVGYYCTGQILAQGRASANGTDFRVAIRTDDKDPPASFVLEAQAVQGAFLAGGLPDGYHWPASGPSGGAVVPTANGYRFDHVVLSGDPGSAAYQASPGSVTLDGELTCAHGYG